LHNWKISLETGCALSGGHGQVKAYPVKILNQKIYVAFEEGTLKETCDDPGMVVPKSIKDPNS
jgi:hypothetical protein